MGRTVSLVFLLVIAASLEAQVLRTVPLRTRAEASEYRHLLNRLERSRLSVAWEDRELHDVVKDLAKRLEINILIAAPLEERKAETISMTLRRVNAGTLLKLLEESLGVAFQNRQGVVWVTTPQDAIKHAIILRVYVIAELLYVPPDFPAPRSMGLSASGWSGPKASGQKSPGKVPLGVNRMMRRRGGLPGGVSARRPGNPATKG